MENTRSVISSVHQLHSFSAKHNMGEFPSGQREQTVNLPSTTSVVRIHSLPPKPEKLVYKAFRAFFIALVLDCKIIRNERNSDNAYPFVVKVSSGFNDLETNRSKKLHYELRIQYAKVITHGS